MKVCEAPTKEPESETEPVKEIFKEAKKSLTEASTSSSKDQLESRMDPSMLTTFFETCMNFLHGNKAIKGLQEMITRCAGLGEPCVVRKLGKHTLRTGQEIRLMMKICEYEMDQVILDLGSDVNVLQNQTWGCMGMPVLQWFPIQLRMANQKNI